MTTKTLYIALMQFSYENEPSITFGDRDMTEYYAKCSDVTLYKLLETREIELPVIPSQAELNGIQIEGLQQTKETIQREARAKAKAIDERIANLLCLEHLEA